MDVCTASMMVITNAVACLPMQVCHVEGDITWCSQDWTKPITCPTTAPQQEWICKREDGTTYSITRPIGPEIGPR